MKSATIAQFKNSVSLGEAKEEEKYSEDSCQDDALKPT